ncbi:MAG: DedA family protein [Parachlamydiaceae bacterium]
MGGVIHDDAKLEKYLTCFMDILFQYICENAHYAGMIMFILLMLAGLNVPISEDIILLTSGALVSSCLPNQYLQTYLWIFLGSWISAWEAYLFGRLLGPKLYNIKWFNWIITKERINQLSHYYEKFGIFTFIIGRFFPGGIRNALYITSGMSKMPFLIFIIRDGTAALISTNILFYLGYVFGQNHDLIIKYFMAYNKIFISCLLIIFLCITLSIWIKKGLNRSNDT